MSLDVSTNDAAALTDSDLDELASMEEAFSAGQLSKAKEDWVLITTARSAGKLHGFTFSTLERIGGTPCVLLGLMSVKRSSKRDQVLRGLIGEAYHRALMAFPDEDVVVGCRFVNADGLEAFKDLRDVTPSPGSTAVGEERAWGRRLAKRFGIEAKYDPTTFTSSTGGQSGLPRPRVVEAREAGPGHRRDVRRGARRQGRRDGGVRLDHGRGSRQARSSLDTPHGRVRRGRAKSADDAVVRRTPVDPAVIDDMVDLASRAPSAGKAQGWHLVVLEGDDTAVFWDTTLPAVRRDSFRWQQLLNAPVIALPFADSKAYTDRYAEPDKIQTGPRCRPRRLARALLDDRRVDVGHDAAAGGREPRSRRTVLRGVPGRARAASGAERPAGSRTAGALAIGHPGGEVSRRHRSGPQRRSTSTSTRRDHPPGSLVGAPRRFAPVALGG